VPRNEENLKSVNQFLVKKIEELLPLPSKAKKGTKPEQTLPSSPTSIDIRRPEIRDGSNQEGEETVRYGRDTGFTELDNV
jgi:hypothetical protein